jgi:hypothetical protein
MAGRFFRPLLHPPQHFFFSCSLGPVPGIPCCFLLKIRPWEKKNRKFANEKLDNPKLSY